MIRDDLPERFHQRWETILAHVGSRATSSPASRSPQPRTRAPAIPLEMGPEEPGGDSRPRRFHGLLQHRTAVTSRLTEQPRLADSEHFAILVLHAGCQLAVLLSDYAQAVTKENIDLDDDAPI